MSILTPKNRNIIDPSTPPVFESHSKFKGEIRCLLRDEMGNVIQDTGWIPNIITNYGVWTMTYVFSYQGPYGICLLGSSNQAPAVTDTSLIALLDYQDSNLSGSWANNGAPNWDYYSIKGFRFNAGTATGTIREMGLSYYSDNTRLTIRTLVTPEIVKGIDQVLDVYHRLTCYPDITTKTGTIVVSGITYDFEQRPAEMDQAFNAHGECGGNEMYFYNGGAFGLIDGHPTGSQTYLGVSTNEFISRTNNETGVENCIWRSSWGLDYSGVVDFAFFRFSWTSTTSQYGMGYQVSFESQIDSTGVPKAETEIMSIDYKYTFSRYP